MMDAIRQNALEATTIWILGAGFFLMFVQAGLAVIEKGLRSGNLQPNSMSPSVLDRE